MGSFQICVLPFDHQIEMQAKSNYFGGASGTRALSPLRLQEWRLRLVQDPIGGGCSPAGGSSLALSPSERSAAYALICTAVPVSDCTLDAGAMELTEDEFASGDRTGVFIAEVESKEALAPAIRRLYLRLLEPSKIKFTAGQFVNVEVPAPQKLRLFNG